MIGDTTALTSWLMRTATGGGLLLLVVWALSAVTRQPAQRQRLGECGLLAALVVACLSWGPVWIPLRLSFIPAAPLHALSERDIPREELSTAPYEIVPSPAEERGMELPAPIVEESTTLAQPATIAPDAPTLTTLTGGRWVFSLAAAYLLCGLLLLSRWLVGWFALWRFLRACRPAPRAVVELFADVTRGLKHPPRLLMSRGLQAPVSCGLWRPAVIVPASFCEPKNFSQLRWVFAHELTHLQRFDPWSCLLFGLGQAVYFYCPWFWWLRRQVRLCQEYVADAAAARLAGHAEDYAQFLVSLAEAPAGPRVAIGVMGKSSDLFRRVTMLLQHPPRVETRCSWRWSLTTATGLLAVAVVAAGLGLQAAAPDEETTAPQKKEEPKKERKILHRSIVIHTGDGEVLQFPPQELGLEDLRKALDKLPKSADTEKLKKALLERIEAGTANPAYGKIRVLHSQPVHDEKQREKPKAEGKNRQVKVVIQTDDGEKILNLSSDDIDLEAIRKALKDLPKNADIDKLKQDILKQVEKLKAEAAELQLKVVPVTVSGNFFSDANPQDYPLGVEVDTPDPVLSEQLDLPKGQGLLIAKVYPNTPAVKAGLKKHDILLQFNDKPVSSNPENFAKMVRATKTGIPLNAVVIRKGKKEVVKGITLKEVKKEPTRDNTSSGDFAPGTPKTPNPPVPPALPQPKFTGGSGFGGGGTGSGSGFGGGGPGGGFGGSNLGGFAPANSMMTSVIRINDRFTGRHQEGSLIITVTGAVADGQAKVSEIHVQDGMTTEKYASVDKVPERYQDKVKSLVEMSEKGNVKVESRSGKRNR